MTKARTLADMISDGVIGTTELADDVITPVKLDETGSYVVSGLTANGNTIINERLDVNKQGEAFRLRTGGASTQNYISIGRTGEDARITMSGAANNAIQTSAAGDLVIGANNNLLLGRIGNPYINLNSTGVVLNELGGADKDFRVESDNNANMLFVDAGNDQVVVGDNGNYFSKFTVVGGKTRSTGIPLNQLSVYDNSAMASSTGGAITLWGNYTTGGAQAEGASIEAYKSNGTSGNYQYGMWLKTRTHGGSMDDRLFMDQAQTVFNETGANTDFRVESDNNANMFFVNAGADTVHIGSSSGSSVFNIYSTGRGGGIIGLNVVNEDSGNDVNTLFNTTNNIDQDFQIKVSEVGASTKATYIGPSTNTNLILTGASIGTLNKDLALSSTSIVVNQDSRNMDFRVESDANANALFIDSGYNSGKGAAIFGSNSAPETGTDYYIAASMLKYSDAQPVMATGAAWNFPSVPSNRQTQANRWRFMGFTLPYNGSNAYRADSSYAQFVCELPNGGPSGKSNLEICELGFNRGWSSGFYMVEVYENYYTNSGYKKYLFHGGYEPSFTLYENYGNNSIALNVLSEGPFQDGTSSVSSSTVDQSYYRKTVRASYGAYWGGMIVLTVPSWTELTLNGAEVDNSNKIRLLNPQ